MDIRSQKMVIVIVLGLLVGGVLFNFSESLVLKDITGGASGIFNFCIKTSPVGLPIPNQTAFVGSVFNFTVNFTDLNPFVYSDNTIIFNISNSTGLINFTPSVGQIGVHFITINATDSGPCGSSTSSVQLILTIQSSANVGRPILEAWLRPNNQDVILNWSNVTGAESYFVYYSNNLTALLNLNTSNIPSNIKNTSAISILNYTDTMAVNNQSKYYRVASFKGGALNLSVETAGKLDISLQSGFNLISTPFLLKFNNLTGYNPLRTRPINSIDTIYNSNFQKIDRISSQWWPASNSNFDLIEGGRGYFVFANKVSNLTFAGLVLNTFNVSISSGFNLLGWFDAFETNLGDESISKPINTSTAGCVDSIYEFDATTKTFKKTDYVSNYGFWPAQNSNLQTIKPGTAYWFNAKTNCNWLR